MKQCKICELNLNESEFGKYKTHGITYLRNICKKCSSIEQINYQKANKEKVNKKQRGKYFDLKLKIFYYYSKGKFECNCCGEKEFKFLTLDHINNDGKLHRKTIGNTDKIFAWIIKNNYPSGFEILCYNCNIGRYRNGGICPHKSSNCMSQEFTPVAI